MLDKLQHKIPPPVWGLFFAGMMYLVAQWLPLISWSTQLATISFIILAGVGMSIDLYAVGGFFKAKTTINPLSLGASTLITHGLYQYSRNPMYLGMLFILSGWACYLGALSALLILPLFVLVINQLQIKPEEVKLQQLFGQEYLQYCDKVRRWL
ncbi:MAG: isoprenylcysteine carboxylmethyltransferase family protein [Gammaproteobacteria bacterium]|nr:isoprenylcysteine carboxylmethyltransferase family protein [Gammaproteobacteria bacterium]